MLSSLRHRLAGIERDLLGEVAPPPVVPKLGDLLPFLAGDEIDRALSALKAGDQETADEILDVAHARFRDGGPRFDDNDWRVDIAQGRETPRTRAQMVLAYEQARRSGRLTTRRTDGTATLHAGPGLDVELAFDPSAEPDLSLAEGATRVVPAQASEVEPTSSPESEAPRALSVDEADSDPDVDTEEAKLAAGAGYRFGDDRIEWSRLRGTASEIGSAAELRERVF